MSHYFSSPTDSGRRHKVRAQIWGREFSFVSAPGVFSSHRLDIGTSVLLSRVDPPDSHTRRALDLGCGFGPIAVALAAVCPGLSVDAVEVNALARTLTVENAAAYGVADRVHVASPDSLPPASYDEIWSNPPIRIGKEQLHAMLLHWLPMLAPGGIAWLVVGKNLGADSLRRWLTDGGWPTTKMASAKGFRILKVEPPA